jgi:diguanylate cyclase (GGDEF)-like protein/PAS domain S-box-containing protein
LAREIFRKSLANDLAGSEYHENPIITRTGEIRMIAWHNSCIRNRDGVVIGGLSAGEDITEQNLAVAALRESEQFLRTVLDQIPDPVILKDYKGDFLLCNQTVARLYNSTPEAMIGKNDGDFGVPRDMADFFRDNVLGIMAKGETEIVYEDSTDILTGEVRHFKSIKKPFKDADNKNQILIVAQDITDVIKAQEQVVESERRLQEVLEITREGIWDWHMPSGKVTHNPQWYETLQAQPGDIPETVDAFSQIIHPDDQAQVWQRIEALLKGDSDDYHSEHRLMRKDGVPIWVQDRGRVVERDKQGNPLRVIGSFSDISLQKEHQVQLEHIAHHDTLTGLPNRALLADRLHQAMAQAQRRSEKLAVAYLDLDGFKEINDQHGHDIGDQLLTILADRMKHTLREGDTLARMGGDEFVAVLGDLTDVEESLPMINRLLDAAAQPVLIGELTLQVSASIGVTFYPQSEDVDADQLLRQADQSMYQAKLAGKNRYHLFDPALDRSVRGRHESLDRIRRALLQNEFVLYYQPKVNMRTGKVIGAEALIRWQHPERGLVLPGAFLPFIEDHPLSIELGEWVIETALTQIERWRGLGLDIPVSVNISAHQLQQATFVERLLTRLASHHGIKPGCLELEILETSALQDVMRVSRVINACHDIGVNFALDDFGTGYSSLTYLKQLPADVLKIDQSFVRDMLDDPEDLVILEGVLSLASAFRRSSIAEGVENVEQGLMLLQLGCELAQGYAIARPMPADSFPDWLAAWRPDPRWALVTVVPVAELPLVYAGVELRAWILAIESKLSGALHSSPPLDIHQCRFGDWLDAERPTDRGAHPSFQAMDKLHQGIHSLALEMLTLQNQGETSGALVRLDELHRLRDELLGQLQKLIKPV